MGLFLPFSCTPHLLPSEYRPAQSYGPGPGPGKTTVALTETDRAGLVAGYVGQTARREAIDTLVKAMEDLRGPACSHRRRLPRRDEPVPRSSSKTTAPKSCWRSSRR